MSDAPPLSSSKPLRDRNENQVSLSSNLSTIRYLTEQSQLGIGTVRALIHLPRFLLSTKAWSVLLFGKSTVHPHEALEKGCSNRMHRFLSTNWQLLQLWWHMGVQKHFCCHLAVLSCALSLKKGNGKHSATRLPTGPTWQHRNCRNPYPSGTPACAFTIVSIFNVEKAFLRFFRSMNIY